MYDKTNENHKVVGYALTGFAADKLMDFLACMHTKVYISMHTQSDSGRWLIYVDGVGKLTVKKMRTEVEALRRFLSGVGEKLIKESGMKYYDQLKPLVDIKEVLPNSRD